MSTPDFHDGSFDGFLLRPDNEVYLFLRTEKHEPFTLALDGVEALAMSNVRSGNIIFDIQVTNGQDLTTDQMATVYEVAPTEMNRRLGELLSSAKERDLSMLEMSSSYGAECRALFRAHRFVEGHVFGKTGKTGTA